MTTDSVAVVEHVVSAARPGAPVPEATGHWRAEAIRLLAACSALGAGLTFFALAANAALSADGGFALVVIAVFAGLAALLQTLWGLTALRGEAPRLGPVAVAMRLVRWVLPASAAVVLGALVWGTLLAPPGARSFDLTLACTATLLLIQLCCHGVLRRLDRNDQQHAGQNTQQNIAQPPAGRLVASLFFSSLVVAGITTPGLAASTAGDFAVPHGEHGSVPIPAEHPGH